MFAGSGQIGLEALSRGAAYAVFVENSRKAASCIEDNIHFTKFDKVSRLMMTDAVTAVRTLEGKYKFDIVFMDPPYNKELEKEVLITLSDSDILRMIHLSWLRLQTILILIISQSLAMR